MQPFFNPVVKTAAVCLALLLLSACADIESELSFEDFQTRVSSLAGAGAEDCGIAEIGEGSNQTQCIAAFFGQELPSFAILRQQGSDSVVADAFAVSAIGRVFELSLQPRSAVVFL